MIEVKFSIGEETSILTVEPGSTLLTAAIEADIGVEYVCKQGRCCTCKVKVLSGEKNLSAPTPNEAFRLGRDKLKRNWRLACQAKVNGPIEVSHTPFLGRANTP